MLPLHAEKQRVELHDAVSNKLCLMQHAAMCSMKKMQEVRCQILA
jgi:hypothetical protein